MPRSFRPARPLAQLALLLVIGSASAALAGACGDGATSVTPTEDGGEESGSVQRADCPTAEPTNGSLCLLPEGTTCDFGQCGTRLAQCFRGAWRLAGNAPPSPPCPADPPTENVKCPACWPKMVSCTYGSTNCSAPDASTNTAIASCPNGTWLLDIRPCRDGGGADVQRDGEPDAD
jgi:hypothetical protein